MHCDLLEDYICRCLAPAEIETFQQHLEHCDDCSNAVVAEAALFDVVSKASKRLEPIPLSLTLRPPITRASSKQSPRSGFAIAVSALALIGLVVTTIQTTDTTRPVPKTPAVSVATVPAYVAPPRIELPNNTSAITIASGDPNITIILMNAPEPADLNLDIPRDAQHLASTN